MTDKSDDRVGHFNTILSRGGGDLNDSIFKSSNARGLPWGGGGGELKFRFDRRIRAHFSVRTTAKQIISGVTKKKKKQNKTKQEPKRKKCSFCLLLVACYHANVRPLGCHLSCVCSSFKLIFMGQQVLLQ